MIDQSLISVYLLSLLSFFAVITPINYIIVYVSLTQSHSSEDRKNIATKSILLGFLIIVITMVFGNHIFHFLGISLYSFKVGGGILLAINGFNMIFGKNVEQPNKENIKNQESDDISLFPLAIPILAGPGAITTGIVLFNSYSGWMLKLIIFLALLTNGLVLILITRLFDTFIKKTNHTTLVVLYRFSGLLIASLAVGIIIGGVKSADLF